MQNILLILPRTQNYLTQFSNSLGVNKRQATRGKHEQWVTDVIRHSINSVLLIHHNHTQTIKSLKIFSTPFDSDEIKVEI